MIKPEISDLYSLKEGGNENSRIIKSVTPISMNIMVPKADDGSYSVLARITWLCKDETDVLFCLTSTYAAEDEYDEEFLVSSPLLADRYYCNYSLTADLLMSTLDHFLTDMNFKFSNDVHRANETEIYCQAFERSLDDNSNNDRLHKIMVSPEVFSTLTFVDHYMQDAVFNNADLYSALVFGADESNNTFIFEANDIDITDIAVVKAKGSREKSLAVRMNVKHFDKSESEIELLALVGLDKGKKILNKAVKKNTLEKISSSYMVKDENQFIQRFMFDKDIKNNEDNYLFIKAVNIKKDGIIVAFNKELQESLLSKIDIILNKIAD